MEYVDYLVNCGIINTYKNFFTVLLYHDILKVWSGGTNGAPGMYVNIFKLKGSCLKGCENENKYNNIDNYDCVCGDKRIAG